MDKWIKYYLEVEDLKNKGEELEKKIKDDIEQTFFKPISDPYDQLAKDTNILLDMICLSLARRYGKKLELDFSQIEKISFVKNPTLLRVDFYNKEVSKVIDKEVYEMKDCPEIIKQINILQMSKIGIDKNNEECLWKKYGSVIV